MFLLGGDIGENVTYTDLTLSSDYQGPEDSSAAPEPGTLLLFASGLGLAWSRIKGKKRA